MRTRSNSIRSKLTLPTGIAHRGVRCVNCAVPAHPHWQGADGRRLYARGDAGISFRAGCELQSTSTTAPSSASASHPARRSRSLFGGPTMRPGFKVSSISESIARLMGCRGNWRAKFKAEPQTPARKVLYRRGGLSHTLSHDLSHRLSHMTYDRPTSEIITRISRAPTLKLGLLLHVRTAGRDEGVARLTR